MIIIGVGVQVPTNWSLYTVVGRV